MRRLRVLSAAVVRRMPARAFHFCDTLGVGGHRSLENRQWIAQFHHLLFELEFLAGFGLAIEMRASSDAKKTWFDLILSPDWAGAFSITQRQAACPMRLEHDGGGENRFVLEMAFEEKLVALDRVTGLHAASVVHPRRGTETAAVGAGRARFAHGCSAWPALRSLRPVIFRGGTVELPDECGFHEAPRFRYAVRAPPRWKGRFRAAQESSPMSSMRRVFVVGLRKFYRRGGGLVTLDDARRRSRDRVDLALFAEADGGFNRFRTAPTQSFFQVGHDHFRSKLHSSEITHTI